MLALVSAGLPAATESGPAGLFAVALAAYAAAWLAAALGSGLGRAAMFVGVSLHVGATLERAGLVGYFPLTNKLESFSAAALCTAIVALLSWRELRAYLLPLVGLVIAGTATALSFPRAVSPPPPVLRTIWYPLHVPLSFLAYALWAAAACGAVAWLATRDDEWLRRIDKLALQGFGLWSLGMITGGVWGVVAWGAYFMWDPKVVWSVILWVFYATFVHVKLTPSLQTRAWVRPALALVGYAFVLVAYVGTSFFFGKSSHAF